MPHSNDAAVRENLDENAFDSQALAQTTVQNERPENRLKFGLASAENPEVLDMAEVARFWSRVEVRGPGKCWPWRYGINDDGYGDYRTTDGNCVPAHRVAYLLGHGSIGSGDVIRHSCDNRQCCNFRHLEAGTHQENVQDRVQRGRSAIGEANGRARLTSRQVDAIRTSPLSDEYFARRFGVDRSTIAAVRSGRTWKHLPGGGS